jgi:hypothetical protein
METISFPFPYAAGLCTSIIEEDSSVEELCSG